MELTQLLGVEALNYGVMAVVVATAAFLQGVGGVGFAMLAAPIAVFLAPNMVPGSLLVLGGSVSLLAALRERHEIVKPVVSWALAGRLVGTIIAAVGMTQLPSDWKDLLSGLGLWPFMFLGFQLSSRARHAVSPKNIRLFLLWFCGVSSVTLIVKSLL